MDVEEISVVQSEEHDKCLEPATETVPEANKVNNDGSADESSTNSNASSMVQQPSLVVSGVGNTKSNDQLLDTSSRYKDENHSDNLLHLVSEPPNESEVSLEPANELTTTATEVVDSSKDDESPHRLFHHDDRNVNDQQGTKSNENNAYPVTEKQLLWNETPTTQGDDDNDDDDNELPLEQVPKVLVYSEKKAAEDITEKNDLTVDAELEQQQQQQPSTTLPWWYPKCCGRPVLYGNPEALAFAFSVVGQAGILIGIGAFISPALVTLAKRQAGCATEAPPGEDEIPPCEGTVYGIKPSSLLTIMSSIVGLASAFIIPVVGAVVDFTSHRRLIGRWCSALYSALILTLVFLSEDSWFILSFLLLLAASMGWALSMLFFAYLPELTDDESRLNQFSKTFTVLIFTTMVVYLAVVVGIATAIGVVDNDVAVARCSAVVSCVLSAVLFYLSWGILFQERPASHELEPGQGLWTAGFIQVKRTTVKIYNDYNALKWFYVSICFGDAAIQSLSVIAITYVTDQLELSSQEVAVAALLMLLGSIPGALVGAWVNRKFNPVRSSSLAVAGMVIGTTCASIFLKGAGQQILTYFFAFLWGGGTGWKYTGDRVLAAGIVPEGQDAELMGFFMFCGQVFAWVPSLVFTVLNEAGVSQRIGLASLNIAFLGALVSYCMMGDYGDAIRVADRLRLDTVPSLQIHQHQHQQHAPADRQEDFEKGQVLEMESAPLY